jgi:hypothetical protein
MDPDKGAHRAIAVARAAGKKLLLAAKMWQPEERRYFDECVRPLLGPDAVYVGEVGARHKLELLAGAEALINPIRWPEPFGLVMIEALATGTPVLAFAEGAAPEIIDHGRTGFICVDEVDMITKLRNVAALDRTQCRRDAEKRFSTNRMIADHVALYRRVLAEPQVARPPARPRTLARPRQGQPHGTASSSSRHSLPVGAHASTITPAFRGTRRWPMSVRAWLFMRLRRVVAPVGAIRVHHQADCAGHRGTG